jgi:N-acetylmuramoyl-L-alanine amidase
VAAFAAMFVALALLASCGSDANDAPSTQVPPTARAASTSPAATATAVAQAHIVAISAGHGGSSNVGATHRDAQGNVDLIEKDLTLDVARRLDALLRADGYRTVMLRDGDYSLTEPGAGSIDATRRESQARADIANDAGADVVLALHFNGHEDPSQSGTEVYYNPDRAFGEQNEALARYVHDALLGGLRSAGYESRDRGLLNDAPIGARFEQDHTFLLGQAPGFRVTTMPGIICEPLFVTNDTEAALLQRDDVLDAIAQAYKAGIDAYFAWLDARG